MAGFTLDPRLAASTLDIGAFSLCRVLRANDQNFPWLILVPMREGARDVIDLAESDLALMWREVGAALRVLKDQTNAHKLNVAALGNAGQQQVRRGIGSVGGVAAGALLLLMVLMIEPAVHEVAGRLGDGHDPERASG